MRNSGLSVAFGLHRQCAALILAALLLCLAACGARDTAATPEAFAAPTPLPNLPSELRVGTAANYPPLSFKQDGQLTGIEIDFANRLARELGVHVSFIEVPLAELISGLLEHRYDVIMSGLSITPARRDVVAFTQPYLEIGQMTIVRSSDYDRLKLVENLNIPANRVAVVGGSTAQAYVQTNLPNSTLKTFLSVEDAVAALRAREVDAFIHDAPAIWDVRGRALFFDDQLRGIYAPLTREELAWAVRKQDTNLQQHLDAALSKWKANGVIEQILDFWMPVRKLAVTPR